MANILCEVAGPRLAKPYWQSQVRLVPRALILGFGVRFCLLVHTEEDPVVEVWCY